MGTVAAIVAALAVTLAHSSKGKAASGGDHTESKVQSGFAIAPVDLNLAGKNRAQVGLGSYLANAVGDCNGCHHATTLSDSSPYTPEGDPFRGHPNQVEQAGYLAEAEGFNDNGRAEQARAEIDALTEQLAAAVGLGGRGRVTGGAAERARSTVTHAIKAALRNIRGSLAALADELALRLKTGTFCVYTPDPAHPPDWTL